MIFDQNPFYVLPEGIETRWASPENPMGEKGKGGQKGEGRKGAAFLPLKAGESYILAQEKERSGTIRRIWMTISQRDISMLRGLRLDFYWDGSAKPAVSAPLGDFFGTGLGRLVPFQSALFTSPEGKSFHCNIPMPFKHGMKLVITNESMQDLNMLFYDVNYTVGDKHDLDTLYFHAHYRRENPTTMQKDYEILPKITGKGRYLGSNIGVIANRKLYYTSWWGEGEIKLYIDGDTKYPTLCGTGTEDYIGTGWGQGKYDHLYQGCHFADHENMHYCFYRYHIPDPIYFRKDIRVTIQQIGCWSPDTKCAFHYNQDTIFSTAMEKLDFAKTAELPDYGLFERSDDWSSCTYFYLDNAMNMLPEIDSVEKRI